MNDPMTFSWQSTPASWACYYDPEGPVGFGKTKEAALRELIADTDGDEFQETMLAGAIVAAVANLEQELAEANACERENFRRAEHNLARAGAAEADNAALRYVVEKAAAWDPENTDNADLAALGAYARAALAGKTVPSDCGGIKTYCPCCTCGSCRTETARRLAPTDHGHSGNVDEGHARCGDSENREGHSDDR